MYLSWNASGDPSSRLGQTYRRRRIAGEPHHLNLVCSPRMVPELLNLTFKLVFKNLHFLITVRLVAGQRAWAPARFPGIRRRPEGSQRSPRSCQIRAGGRCRRPRMQTTVSRNFSECRAEWTACRQGGSGRLCQPPRSPTAWRHPNGLPPGPGVAPCHPGCQSQLAVTRVGGAPGSVVKTRSDVVVLAEY